MTADMHEMVARELTAAAKAVATAGMVADPRFAVMLLGMTGLLVRIHEEHAPDHKGRCRACGRRPGCPAPVITSWAASILPAGDQ